MDTRPTPHGESVILEPSLIFTLVLAGILGPILSSFCSVLIYRGPSVWGLVAKPDGASDSFSLWGPRSHCPSCHTQLTNRDLIPIIGFWRQRGRCRHCNSAISRLYPAVEVAGLIAGITAVLMTSSLPTALLLLLFCLGMMTLSIIDARTGFLPDALTLPLMGLGIIGALIAPWITLPTALMGAGVGYGTFFAVGWLYRKWRGVDGLGGGDAKMLGAIGAFVGPLALPFVVLAAALSALSWLAVTGQIKDGQSAIRFGPFLGIAGVLTLSAQRVWPNIALFAT